MPPIPIHTSSPINTNHPANAFGTSPSSAAARYTPPVPVDVDAEPTTTAAAQVHTQAARPGAPAVPQPTNALSSNFNNRLEPTATSAAPTTTGIQQSDSPPPPQPGAVPSLPTSQNNWAPKLTIPPPPPRPADVAQEVHSPSPVRHALPSPTPTRTHPPQALPAQLYSPTRAIPPAGVTSPYPAPQDLSHPPGYMQDSRASFDDKPVEFCQPLDRRASPSSSRRGGILDGEPTFERDSDDEAGVLNTAFAWAKAAGQKLSRTEEQIWKKVNGGDHS